MKFVSVYKAHQDSSLNPAQNVGTLLPYHDYRLHKIHEEISSMSIPLEVYKITSRTSTCYHPSVAFLAWGIDTDGPFENTTARGHITCWPPQIISQNRPKRS